jgi:hypothetical protein
MRYATEGLLFRGCAEYEGETRVDNKLELTEMRGAELVIFFAFLLAPPLLLGFLALALLRRRFAQSSSLVKLGAGVSSLAGALALAAVMLGPAWLGRYIGVREFQLFGPHLSWAPFAFIAVAAAVALVLVWTTKRGR